MRKFKEKPSRKNGAILKQRQSELPRKINKPHLHAKILEPSNKRSDLCNERHPNGTIFPCDIASIMNVCLRTAQKKIQDARFLLGKGKMAYVTIEEFCALNELNKESIQKTIDSLDEIPDADKEEENQP